jgi:hypothetical protein
MRRRTVVIVLLLIALLAGLSLPAIMAVREAATRMHCTSNLKQLAMALHGYADTFPRSPDGKDNPTFPAGTIPNPDLPAERRLSWYVSILPYLEQKPVYEQFDLKAPINDDRNRSALTNRFFQTVCPASGQPRTTTPSGSGDPAPVTHYVGVAGVGADAATLPIGHPRAGVFGYDRRTAVHGMPDGASNTLLLIETAQNPGHWAYGGPATVRGIEPGTAPYIGVGRPFGGFHEGSWDWGKPRTHSCMIAMADGSVRQFSNTTAPEVLEALATVGGKEELPAN